MAGVRVVARLLWVVASLLAWHSSAAGMPVQEISNLARGRVAHLSVRDAKGEEQGSGSGFVISSDGRLVTNFHVIDGATSIVAVFPDKREVAVTGAWAFDEEVDIAILQLAPGQYAPLTLAAGPAYESEEIVVIGSPLGLGNSISTGIVSAVREKGIEKEEYREGTSSWVLQITAAAAPGSSGSPILRSNGDVVGVLVGHISGLDAHFGIAVGEVNELLAKAPARVLSLNAATGARSVTTNLMISGAFLAGVALLWVIGSQLNQRRQRRATRPQPH